MRKRDFQTIRRLLLEALLEEKKTINEISKDSGVNWKTVDNHLSYLSENGLVEPVLNSEYARIYRITDRGRRVIQEEELRELKT